jgi:hypothetical protein
MGVRYGEHRKGVRMPPNVKHKTTKKAKKKKSMAQIISNIKAEHYKKKKAEELNKHLMSDIVAWKLPHEPMEVKEVKEPEPGLAYFPEDFHLDTPIADEEKQVFKLTSYKQYKFARCFERMMKVYDKAVEQTVTRRLEGRERLIKRLRGNSFS